MNINFITTNNVTNNTMRKLITILTTIFIIALLAIFASCDSETGNTTATTTPDSAATTTPPDDSGTVPEASVDAGDEEKASEISFEMPEGWEVNGNSAYLYEQPKDSAAGYVEVEVYAGFGTEEDAKKEIEDLASQKTENNAVTKELTIDGRKIFLEEEHTDEYFGDYWWSNYLKFEKNGRVYTVWMTDRVENQQEAIKRLVETVKIVEK